MEQCTPFSPKAHTVFVRPSPAPARNSAAPRTPGWHHRIWPPVGNGGASTAVPWRSCGRSPDQSQTVSGSHSMVNRELPSHFVSLVRSSDTCLKPKLIWKTLGFWVEVLLKSWTCTWRFIFSFQTSQSKTDGIFPPLHFPHKSAF